MCLFSLFCAHYPWTVRPHHGFLPLLPLAPYPHAPQRPLTAAKNPSSRGYASKNVGVLNVLVVGTVDLDLDLDLDFFPKHFQIVSRALTLEARLYSLRVEGDKAKLAVERIN